MDIFVYDSVIVFIISFLYALIEIEMEGKHGWGRYLPTTKKFLGHLTLYHVYMLAFLFMVFVLVFLPRFKATMGCSTQMSTKSFIVKLLFYFLSFVLIEDFLWFVLNPNYTLANYNEKSIPWHKGWILGIPKNYYFGFAAVGGLLLFSQDAQLLQSLLIMGGLIVLTIVLAPLYHKFYRSNHSKELLELCENNARGKNIEM